MDDIYSSRNNYDTAFKNKELSIDLSQKGQGEIYREGQGEIYREDSAVDVFSGQQEGQAKMNINHKKEIPMGITCNKYESIRL